MDRNPEDIIDKKLSHIIYADNAATTKTSEAVVNAMLPYMTGIYGNPSSLHTAGQYAKEALEDARRRMAKALGGEPHGVYFTSGGSEADNQALMTCAAIGEKKGKKHIISTAFEHHAVLHALKKLEKQGFEITLLPVHENGIVVPDEVAAAIREDTVCVSVMYANNEIGTVQPIAEIGRICREKGVIFHTDAVQAVGHIDVNIERDNIDMLSLSAHKFHGPKGVGALYCKKGIPVYTLIEGGAQERGKRAGTENVAGIVGMATALEISLENLKEKGERLTAMRNELIDGLLKIPHSRLNGDREKRLPGNINMCFEGIEGESLLLYLDDKGICASSGSACTSGSLDPSHVLLAIGLIHDIAHGSLRISLCEENTEEEIKYMIKAVCEVVEHIRSMSPVWHDLQEGRRQYVIQ